MRGLNMMMMLLRVREVHVGEQYINKSLFWQGRNFIQNNSYGFEISRGDKI
jgi:hypothetical protein